MKVQKFSNAYIATRVAWINDIRVNANMHFDLPVSIDGTETWYKRTASCDTRVDFVFLDEDGQPTGMTGLTNIDIVNASAEFYIFVNPEIIGKGNGTMLTKWTVNFGFLRYNLNKIYLYTDADNNRAMVLYERLGFFKEGIQRKHRYKNGVFKDKVAFGLLREEWAAKAWAESEIRVENI